MEAIAEERAALDQRQAMAELRLTASDATVAWSELEAERRAAWDESEMREHAEQNEVSSERRAQLKEEEELYGTGSRLWTMLPRFATVGLRQLLC